MMNIKGIGRTRYFFIWAAVWACVSVERNKQSTPQGVAAAAAAAAAAASRSSDSLGIDISAPLRPTFRRVHAKYSKINTRSQCRCAPGLSDTSEKTLAVRGGSTNKKYTAAAAEAMKTMNSFTFGGNARQSKIPTLQSESALMDKETNAIYWQGGADILSSSLTHPYLTQRGVLHVKATILTVLLWMWVWGNVSRYLTSRYFAPSSGSLLDGKLLFTLPFISSENAPTFLRKIASCITPVIQFFLLLVHALLYLRLPQYSPNIIAITILLYLLESYSCSTRRYLSHAMNAPDEVEAYLERIRNIKPSVTWKVRCFHYEDRELWKSMKGVRKIWESRAKESNKPWDKIGGKLLGMHLSNSNAKPASASTSDTVVESPILWATRKVVTHQAVGTYKFGSCEDRTLASLWKRSESFSPTSYESPFSKLTLSKLLVLKDKNTRDDYFAQQAAFVMLEGRKDVHAEFSTTIEVEGFRPKLLAVRSVPRAPHSAALFRQHIYILFTLLGLSLPYRIWFAKHCDEVRVTVVKETGIVERPSKEVEITQKSSWFPGKWGWGVSQSSADVESKRNQELFRKNMQQFALYEDKPTSLEKSVANENVVVDVDAHSETVSSVETVSTLDDLHDVQESTPLSLSSSDSAASNLAAITVVDEPTGLQTSTLVDNSTLVDAEEESNRSSPSMNIDAPTESINENTTMDDTLPLVSPTSDDQNVQ